MNEIWMEYKTTRKATWEVSNYGNVKKNGEPYECSITNSGYKYSYKTFRMHYK